MKTLSFFAAVVLSVLFLFGCNSEPNQPKHLQTDDMFTATGTEIEKVFEESFNVHSLPAGSTITFNDMSILIITRETINVCAIIYQTSVKNTYHQSPWLCPSPENVIICNDIKEGDKQWARFEVLPDKVFRLEVHLNSLKSVQ